jgi:hypothetical protein
MGIGFMPLSETRGNVFCGVFSFFFNSNSLTELSSS